MMIDAAAEAGRRWSASQRGTAPDIFHAVRRMPYASTGRRSVADLLREGRGACTAKHLLLRDRLSSVGIPATIGTVFGRFGEGLPVAASMPATLQAMIRAGGVPDYHHYVTATIDGRPTILDATWHDALVPFDFPVNMSWQGSGDTVVAVQGIALGEAPDDLVAFKAARIAELPSSERDRRHEFLTLLTDWISGLTPEH